MFPRKVLSAPLPLATATGNSAHVSNRSEMIRPLQLQALIKLNQVFPVPVVQMKTSHLIKYAHQTCPQMFELSAFCCLPTQFKRGSGAGVTAPSPSA